MRYVITSSNACRVIVLELAVHHLDGSFSAEVRRVVMNKSFEKIYDGKGLTTTVIGSHVLGPVIPRRRMTFDHEIVLTDRDGDERICIAESFNTGHNTLILIKDVGIRRRSGVIVSAVNF